MSDEFEGGRNAARSGNWRSDFSSSEAEGYRYQKMLMDEEQYNREQDEARRRRAAQDSAGGGDAYGGDAYGGGAYGGTSQGGAGGDPITGLIGLVVVGGTVLYSLLPLIIRLLLVAAAFVTVLYVYDLCRHRKGFRHFDDVTLGLSRDCGWATCAALRWLAACCRKGQAASQAVADRLAHRVQLAGSLPARVRSHAGRAVVVVARRLALGLCWLLVKALGGLLQGLAVGLEWLHREA